MCVAQPAAPRKASLPWEQWLSQPDRREIRWNISVSTPRLTYDLRHLVLVNLEVAESALAGTAAPDLHLLIKAGDGTHWYPGDDYSHYAVPEVSEKLTIQFLSALYLSPGRHVLGITLFDSANQRLSTAHRSITIPSAGNDALATLDEQLPPVEFASVNAEASTSQRWRPRGHTGPRIGQSTLNIAGPLEINMLSRTTDHRLLRLHPPAPVEIDVLVNFTPTSREENSRRAYSASQTAMWGIVRVLALLKPVQGCVLLSGIDVLGQKVIFDRIEGRSANWQQLGDAVSNIDAHTIDLRSLEAHQRMSDFFRDQVSQLTAGNSGCPDLPSNATHIYIVATDGVVFPAGTPHPSVQSIPGRAVQLYYLRRGEPWDEMEHVVKPLHPHHLKADTPDDLRRSLLRIVNDLGRTQ
jgi:hypothetical protein